MRFLFWGVCQELRHFSCAFTSLTAQIPFFTFGREKGLAKWSVAIGDHYAEKISACEPLAFNTFLCTAPGESLEKYAYFKGSVKDRHVDFSVQWKNRQSSPSGKQII